MAPTPLMSTRWVFTHWLQGGQTQESVTKKLLDLENTIRFAVAQIEGPHPETGKYHLQGYLEINKNQRMTGMKKLLFKSTRWAIAKGTADENITYCTKSKDDDGKIVRAEGCEPIMFGTPGKSSQGKRNDLNEIKSMIDSGAQNRELWDAHFGTMARCFRGMSEYKKVSRKTNRGQPTITVLWGQSGTGKSVGARAMAHPDDDDVFWLTQPNSNRVWWDGYDGQKTVVIDEFYGWIPYSQLLRMLDYGPMRVETKGGSEPLCATNFIFTSNTPPQDWYRLCDMPYEGEPFLRRLSEFASTSELTCDDLPMMLEMLEQREAELFPSDLQSEE